MNAYLFYQASRRCSCHFVLRLETNQKVNLLNYIPDTMKTKAVE